MFSSQNSQVSSAANYIEDVFSTYLYTGNGSTQTITNGIDLSTKGGMVWIKSRSNPTSNAVMNTNSGVYKLLVTNATTAEQDVTGNGLSAFNTNGFTLSQSSSGYFVNDNALTYASWTFRKQPKFFDVVTYTGTGSSRTVAHNLGSTPGAIFIKKTSSSSTDGWPVYHRSSSNLCLNKTTQAGTTYSGVITSPTATNFTVSSNADANANGQTYVAYLFAHNAGGFGLTGTDNVISCGSYTGNGSTTGPEVTLGYEPQWLLIRKSSSTGNWWLTDNMRGFNVTSDQFLLPNSSGTEITKTNYVKPLATGFQIVNSDFDVNEAGGTYIYIAIRRGPMKVPTSGTSVFSPLYFTGDDSTSRQLTSGFPVDTFLGKRTVGDPSPFVDRLRGKDLQLYTSLTNAEGTGTNYCRFDSSVGPIVGYNASGININSSAYNYRTYSFRRAPSFFDQVCYTGTGVARTVTHNLGVAPELMIVKSRNDAYTYAWPVYVSSLGNAAGLVLESNVASGGLSYWNSTTPTASVFSTNASFSVNASGSTYVAYLFATCAGVSKVFSYTGNGSSQTINCGFTSGARFVLIKRTDSTGNWYVWDTARGIVSGNDAYFELNLSDAEVTSNDTIDTNSTGFVVNQVSATNVNVSSATYIGLAIA